MINVRLPRNENHDPVDQNYGTIKMFLGTRNYIGYPEYRYNVEISRTLLDSNYSGWKFGTPQSWVNPNLLDWHDEFDYFPSGYHDCMDPPQGMYPTITGQAPNRQHYVGDTIRVKAGLHESPDGYGLVYGMSYKWFKDGEPYNDQRNFNPDSGTLTLENAQLSDSGLYHVRITNWFGETISSGVQITIST